MPYTITVSFGQDSEFEFKVPEAEVAATTREDASHWLHREYEALDCAPRNPVGKILLLDVILDVAKYGGAARFSPDGEWAKQFARCCAATLKRDVRVDVFDSIIR